MKISDIIDPLPPDLAAILRPDAPAETRAELLAAWRRQPPQRLSPAEMMAMYSPDAEREAAELRRIEAEADKAEAEAARARAEAERASAEAAAHRSNRRS